MKPLASLARSNTGKIAAVAVTTLLSAACTGSPTATRASAVEIVPPSDELAADPLRLEPNQGQWAGEVQFGGRGAGYHVFLTDEPGALLVLSAGNPDETLGTAVRLSVTGGVASEPIGEDPLPGVANYLRGPDDFITHVPGFGRVRYTFALPGTDLIFAGSDGRRMELHLRLAPGADGDALGLTAEGATPSYVDGDGNAVLETAVGPLVLEAPVAWQLGETGEEPVAVNYLLDGGTVRFALGLFDPERELFIDPIISYQLSIGGSELDAATAVAIDADGNAYVAGHTRSTDFPTTPGAFDQTISTFFGADDAFVMKRDATGTLVWSTALAGSDPIAGDQATAIALDSVNRPVVAGWTTNCYFATAPTPCSTTTTPILTLLGKPNAFLAKLTADGAGVVFARNFGGIEDDRAFAVASQQGAVFVGGRTSSTDFPTAGHPLTVLRGGSDGFVARFSTTGDLTDSRYLGGSADDEVRALTFSGATSVLNSPVAVGTTFSADFPTANAANPTYGGFGDAFVTQFSGLTSSPLSISWSTFHGGSAEDRGTAVASAPQSGLVFLGGDRVVTLDLGELGSGTLPAIPFVAKYGSGVVAERTLGNAPGEDRLTGLVYSPSLERVYAVGFTDDPSFPTVGALASYAGGETDAFLAALSSIDLSSVVPTTFLGTSDADQAHAVALLGSQLAVAGSTGTGSASNAFLARIRLAPAFPDSDSIDEDMPLSVSAPGVLANDDLGGLALKAVVASPPSHAASFSFQADGSFAYSPNADFFGTDSFVYALVPASAGNTPSPGFETATVTITIAPVPDDPEVVLTALSYDAVEEVELVVPAPGVLEAAGASDRDPGETLVARLVDGPLHAASFALGEDGSFSYLGALDFFGEDAFVFEAEDPTGRTSPPVTVILHVANVNDAPVALDDGPFEVAEDTPLSILAATLLANDTDVDGPLLAVDLVTDPVGGTVSLAADVVTFVPTPNYFGPASFRYRVTDNGSPPLDSFATVSITVTPVDDPTLAGDDLFELPLSGTLVVPAPGIPAVLGNDTDADGALVAELLSPPAHGTLSLHPFGGFSYVAARTFPGVDTFTYRARDPFGGSGTALVTITGAPRSGDESATTDEDTPVAITVLANDPGMDVNAPPETEVVYCYDGYDADCGGSDAPATAFAAGRLTRVTDKPGAVAFAYDGAGRLVREARSLVLPGEARTLVNETAFDPNGNPVSKTHPTGVVVERVFDETDREVSVAVRSPGGVTTPLLDVGGGAQGEGWYPFGGLRAWRAASGTLAFTIEQDASGWVTRTSVTSVAPGESAEATYRYASDGNVIAIDSPTENNVGHDSLGRITYDRGNFYSYDDAGNRLSGPGGAVAYPDPSSNRWSSAESGAIAYAFDAAGNVTQRGELALVTADDGTVIALDSPASGKSRFFRDHRNLRVATSGASGNERFVHARGGDLELRLLDPIAEACGLGQVREVTPVEHYLYLGGRRVAMVAGRLEGACGTVGSAAVASIDESHFYFADKMDLARAVYRDSDGRAVWHGELDAYGVPAGAGVDEDPDADGIPLMQGFRLPGQQEIRGTELSENWNRVLDRAAGRYLQPDPNDSSQNPYAYANSQPFALIDPTGARGVVSPAQPLVRGPLHPGLRDPRDEPQCCRPDPPEPWEPASETLPEEETPHPWPGDPPTSSDGADTCDPKKPPRDRCSPPYWSDLLGCEAYRGIQKVSCRNWATINFKRCMAEPPLPRIHFNPLKTYNKDLWRSGG